MKKSFLQIALMTLGYTYTAWSLGLGQLKVHSYLNQPLNAEIELIDVGDIPFSQIKPSLATTDEYERLGLEISNYAMMFEFTVERNQQGRAIIHITTNELMTEPFIEFIMDLSSPKGQLYRTYTLLLDPPNYSLDKEQPQPLVAKATTADISSPPYSEVLGQKNIHQVATYGPTLAHEDIWQIAQRYKSGQILLQQVVLGIVGANPDAFEQGNLNGLRTGSRLKIPNAASLMQIPPELAKQEVLAHDAAWEGHVSIVHVITPPYVRGGVVQSPSVENESLLQSPTLMPIPQFAQGQPISPLNLEDERKLQTEVNIITAALIAVREANVLISKQFQQLQKDNEKLKILVTRRATELKTLKKRYHDLIVSQELQSHQASSNRSGLYWFAWCIVIGLGAGIFYRHQKWKKFLNHQDKKQDEPLDFETNLPWISPPHDISQDKSKTLNTEVQESGQSISKLDETPIEQVEETLQSILAEENEVIHSDTLHEAVDETSIEKMPPLSSNNLIEFDTHSHSATPVPRLESETIDLPDVSPKKVEMMQSQESLNTLFELAKTYIVMGDVSSAKNSLEEVIQSADSPLKEQAQQLLDELMMK